MTSDVAISHMGYVREVFSGIQGEGLYVGERQIFVRLDGCNLNCRFCDTAAARTKGETCAIEQHPGMRDFRTVPNPIRSDMLVAAIRQLDNPEHLHHSVSLTGGEPLAQPEYALSIVQGLYEHGIKVMLETNGSLPTALKPMIPYTDTVSMDIKLDSVAGVRDLMPEHRSFLEIASAKTVFVKMVVAADTVEYELLKAAEMVASVDAEIPVILQPISEIAGIKAPTAAQVLDWQLACKRVLRSVRVIPQCHKIMGQM